MGWYVDQDVQGTRGGVASGSMPYAMLFQGRHVATGGADEQRDGSLSEADRTMRWLQYHGLVGDACLMLWLPLPLSEWLHDRSRGSALWLTPLAVTWGGALGCRCRATRLASRSFKDLDRPLLTPGNLSRRYAAALSQAVSCTHERLHYGAYRPSCLIAQSHPYDVFAIASSVFVPSRQSCWTSTSGARHSACRPLTRSASQSSHTFTRASPPQPGAWSPATTRPSAHLV